MLVLGALTALGPRAIDAYLPTLPTIGRELHTTSGAVQLTLSAYFVGLTAGQLLWGPIADRIGRKRPLAIGLALYALGSPACALAPRIELLAAARAVQALGVRAGGQLLAGRPVRVRRGLSVRAHRHARRLASGFAILFGTHAAGLVGASQLDRRLLGARAHAAIALRSTIAATAIGAVLAALAWSGQAGLVATAALVFAARRHARLHRIERDRGGARAPGHARRARVRAARRAVARDRGGRFGGGRRARRRSLAPDGRHHARPPGDRGGLRRDRALHERG